MMCFLLCSHTSRSTDYTHMLHSKSSRSRKIKTKVRKFFWTEYAVRQYWYLYQRHVCLHLLCPFSEWTNSECRDIFHTNMKTSNFRDTESDVWSSGREFAFCTYYTGDSTMRKLRCLQQGLSDWWWGVRPWTFALALGFRKITPLLGKLLHFYMNPCRCKKCELYFSQWK